MYDRLKLKEELKRDEGVKSKVYKDSLGISTIGVGRNVDDKGLSPAEIDILLENDIGQAARDVAALLPEWETLSDARQRVLLNMAFNMGRTRLAGFAGMLAAMRAMDFEKAADEMMDSRWAKQVGVRAERLQLMMKEG